MSYLADPGGNFASDAHRRVMAVVANPDQDPSSVYEILERLEQDTYVDLGLDSVEEVVEVLKDLEADGDVTQVDGDWINTDEGFDALTGPPASAGGREHE